MNITGKTLLIPHLAYPSEHIRTPGFFNSYCIKHGIDAVMVAWKTRPADLEKAIQAIRCIENISGVVVTIPHKHHAAQFCDKLEGAAALMGVCNVIRKDSDGQLIGRMYDGLGFIHGLLDNGYVIKNRNVLLAGAGGAAAAIAYELASQGIQRLGIVNRSAEKAKDIAKSLIAHFPNLEVHINPSDFASYDLAINGTSLGMHPSDNLPFDPDLLRQDCLVAEVVMQPDVTPLLQKAAASGRPTHKGVHMVTAQIKLLVEFTTANQIT